MRVIAPIENMADVKRLRRRLAKNPRDLLLFCLITETGLKLDQILELKVGQLNGLGAGDPLPVSKGSAESEHQAVVSENIAKAFAGLLTEKTPAMGEYLFKSQKGAAPLAPTSVSRLVAHWFRQANLEGLAGVKSLRKTWELHFKKDPVPVTRHKAPQNGGLYGHLAPAKLSDQIHRKLLDLILTGRLAPGEKLVAQHIANEMDISPMPVRDALHRLAANGFVILESNRSYHVTALSKKDLIEITDLRMILEPIAAVKASQMADRRQIDQIEATAAKFRQAVETGARDTYLPINRDFHFKIYRCSRNRKMTAFIEQLWNMLSPYQYLLSEKSRSHNFTEGGYKTHQRIVSALRQKDLDAMDHWIKQDIQFAFEGFMAEFEQADS